MKPIARQSLLTTLSSYIGVAIGYGNLLWLLPYALQPDQIGLFRTVQDMALLLVPFAQLGIGNGITRFYPKLKAQQFQFFSFSLIMALLGFALVMVLFWISKDWLVIAFAANSPEVLQFLGVVLLIAFFSVLNSILDAFCRSFLKIAVPTFFREVVLRLLVTLLVAVYLWKWIYFEQLMWGLAGIYLFTLLGMIGYMIQVKIFMLRFDFEFPKGIIKEFLKYSLITLLGTTGSILIMKIDSLMVSSMIGLDANAIYTIAFSIAVVIEMPRRAVSQVAMPIVSEYFAKNELFAINKLYKQIAVHQSFICLLLFLGIWSNVDNLYHFVPNSNIYESGKWVVLLIGLGKMSDIFFSINGEIIVFSRFYVFNITATLIMSVAVVVFNLVLIPTYGIEGAAAASLLAMFLYNLIKYFYLKIRLNFDPFSWDVVKIVALGVMTYLIQFLIFDKMETGFYNLIVRSITITILYLVGAMLLKIARDEQIALWKKIRGFRP
jgi:O-antigen/teichoic acid export membrane protein